MKYFTLDELTHSATADALGLDNTPSAADVQNLIRLVDRVLDPAREQFGEPITVSSGFRSVAVNKRVGGVQRSYHLSGRAADLVTANTDGNRRLFKILQRIPHSELIWERDGRWIHVAL